MVAVQRRRFSGLLGKAEMPGVVDIMSCISSVCNLGWELSLRLQMAIECKVDKPFGHTLSILSANRNVQFSGLMHGCCAWSVVLSIFHCVIHG